MLNADASKVSARAKKRGLPQLRTLGAGNRYALVVTTHSADPKRSDPATSLRAAHALSMSTNWWAADPSAQWLAGVAGEPHLLGPEPDAHRRGEVVGRLVG